LTMSPKRPLAIRRRSSSEMGFASVTCCMKSCTLAWLASCCSGPRQPVDVLTRTGRSRQPDQRPNGSPNQLPNELGDTLTAMRQGPGGRRQMWAPDGAERAGKYYLYFPAKDKEGVFRIGAAVAGKPSGPFTAEPQPIAGSYSIDPAVFKNADGEFYMYFGGIW